MLYVPILKCKQGEKDALFALEENVKDQILPLLELTPDVIAKESFSGVEEFWEKRPFLFDVSPEYYEEIQMEEYIELIKRCDNGFLSPVIKLSDSKELVREVQNEVTDKITLRIFIDEILDEDFETIYSELISDLDMTKTNLIIDAQEVKSSKVNEKAFLVKGAIEAINKLDQYENVIFASNSFPEKLDIDRYEILSLPRSESKLFNKVEKYFSAFDINLIYADYSINHWTYFEFIPGIQPSFNIRYTLEDNYVIYKGDTNKKGGLNIEKVRFGANKLVTSSYFLGGDYSWGDNEIYKKASGNSEKSGNLTTWRAIGTNHHITFMVNLLSNRS